MKHLTIVVPILTLLFVIGFLFPLDSYTFKNGICTTGKTPPTKRLELIKGETLEKAQRSDIDPGPSAGCVTPITYVQYLF
jgi:hypothetical protein